MKNFDKLKEIFGERVKENELLARYTTFKIGGPADYFFEAKTTDELVKAIQASRKLAIPVFILGGGTNILIGDKGIRGLVIKNSTNGIRLKGIKGSVFIEADSGVPMNKLVRYTVDEGLQGLEMQLGLPGSVGGAVYMNSKWTHPEGYVGDAVYQATILKPNGMINDVPASYFHFAYDYSAIQKSHDIVLSVVFALKKGDKDALWNIANESIAYRRLTQPQGVFSPGCTFKNISKAQAMSIPTPGFTSSAGYLVDHAGIKGKQVGGAVISTQHANFIINQDKATASDVVKLIEFGRLKVKEVFGVRLEEEIVRVGEF